MDTASYWQNLFQSWPDSTPKQGVIITNGQESIGFTDFLVAPGILAVMRDRPDTIGARKVMIAFSSIAAIKYTDVDGLDAYRELGFM